MIGIMLLAIITAYLRPGPWSAPPVTPETEPGGEVQTVFVYGTLRYAAVRWLVMGSGGQPQPDALDGFYARALDLHAAADHRTPGLRLRVTPRQLARLDHYERLGTRYWRGTYTLASGETAWVYRRYASDRDIQLEHPAPRRISPATAEP